MGANAERVTPKPGDFEPRFVRAASPRIKAAMNRIFSTNKFDNLRQVNVTRGINPAFVMAFGDDYYSEKNFSLGEICVLKLLKMIEDVPARSLILIDELEMALHPSAQVCLFLYLREVSKERNLTVLFSTHSVTLIKTADREEIIFLARENGVIRQVRRPYLSQVLGGLAHIEEKSADIVLYVEDEAGEACLRPLLDLVLAEKLRSNSAISPTWHIVPIGPFARVVDFLEQHKLLHRPNIASYAVLDRDVKDENVAQWEASKNYAKPAWLQQFPNELKYLPWTPEVGIVELCRRDETAFTEKMRRSLRGNTVQLSPIAWDDGLVGSDRRKAAKKWIDDQAKFLNDHFRVSEKDTLNAMGGILAADTFERNRAGIMQEFASIFST